MNRDNAVLCTSDDYSLLLDFVRNYEEQGRSPRTLAVYKRARGVFADWCTANGTGDFRRDFEAWASELRQAKPKSVNVYLPAVKGAILAEAARVLPEAQLEFLKSTIQSIKGVKKAKGQAAIRGSKIISMSEYQEVLDESPARLRLLFSFLWATGCRISEVCDIRLDQIQIENGQAACIQVTGKGSKTRSIRVPVVVYEAARDFYRGRTYLFETSNGTQYNRNYVTRELKRIGRRVLKRNLTAHMFRHTFATRMLAQTRKLKAVSEYLGHASTSTTLDMYVHETLSNEELFSATG